MGCNGICGTCVWHENFNGTTDWICSNEDTAIVFSKIGVSHFRFGEVSQVGVFSLDLPSIVFHKF